MAFDLAKYLEEHHEVVSRSGDEWVIPCICDIERGSKKRHLWVNIGKAVGICYRCNRRYASLTHLLAGLRECSLVDASMYLRGSETATTRLEAARRRLDAFDPTKLADEPLRAPTIGLPEGYAAIEKEADMPRYALKRGVTYKQARLHWIGTCKGGFYKHRLIVPVWALDEEGEPYLASYAARWMRKGTPEGAKVLYPKGSRTGSVLFNGLNMTRKREVVITEGVFDALRVGSCGVAVFGNKLSSRQYELLYELGQTKRLTVMFDPDAVEAAMIAARKLARACGEVFIAALPDHRKDPGECTKEELREARRRAIPIDNRNMILRRKAKLLRRL